MNDETLSEISADHDWRIALLNKIGLYPDISMDDMQALCKGFGISFQEFMGQIGETK